jgi:hypothetical protein
VRTYLSKFNVAVVLEVLFFKLQIAKGHFSLAFCGCKTNSKKNTQRMRQAGAQTDVFRKSHTDGTG